MALTIRCPITGFAYKLPHFTESHTVIALHPLFQASADTLATIAPPTNPPEQYILICAWCEQLSQLGLAHWRGKLNPEYFSPRWFDQQASLFFSMVHWCSENRSHPMIGIVPQLALSPDLTSENLQQWREEAQNILASFTTFFDIAETLRIRKAREKAAQMLESCASDDLPARRANSRRAYMLHSLATHSNQGAVDIALKVVAQTHLYEVPVIRKVKEFCLDYLDERGVENYNDKQEIIELLDAALVEKISLAKVLGGASIEDVTLLSELTRTYTFTEAGTTYTNSQSPKLTAAINAATKTAITDTSSDLPKFTIEPKRADFTNELSFKIAHKLWSREVSK